jgi:hypothetical protein
MNLLMKRIGANVTLPVMVILWGIACTCQGSHFPLESPVSVFTSHIRRRTFLSRTSRVPALPWRFRRYYPLAWTFPNTDTVLPQVALHPVLFSSSPAFINAMPCSSAFPR